MWDTLKKLRLVTLFCVLSQTAPAATLSPLSLSVEQLKQESWTQGKEEVWALTESGVVHPDISPKSFIKNPKILPKIKSTSFSLSIHLDEPAELSLMMPEYPFYELYLGERRLVQHGKLPDQPQRLYREIHLGYGQDFPLTLKISRHSDYWPPYTSFHIGLSDVIHRSQQAEEIYGAFFLGLVIITALYHFSLGVMIPKNRMSVFFGLFLACLALRASLTGSPQILVRLFPSMSWELSWKLGFIGYYLAVPSTLSFIVYLFPRTHRLSILRLPWAFALAMTALTLATPVAVYAKWNDYFHLITLYVLVCAGVSFIRAYRRRMRVARLSLASIGIMFFATVNDILQVLNIVPTRPISDYAVLAFVFSQTAIISYNYANSFRDLYHIHKQLQKLIYKHVVTRIARGMNLEETMPVGIREAAVIDFDVVASSTIKHEHFDRALERVMARCQEILQEGYSEDTIAATGYRIKEMGDGLLCSVGFPFKNPHNESNAETAVKIAERFCRVFAEEMSQLRYHQPIHCAIGIAQGMIEGFFPKSGIRQYDVRGRPLILATRYESMRNIVFKKTGVRSSLIFIQDAVYQSLSQELQASFEHWDCSEKGHRIRDDVQATHAWFKRLPGAEAEAVDSSDKAS